MIGGLQMEALFIIIPQNITYQYPFSLRIKVYLWCITIEKFNS